MGQFLGLVRYHIWKGSDSKLLPYPSEEATKPPIFRRKTFSSCKIGMTHVGFDFWLPKYIIGCSKWQRQRNQHVFLLLSTSRWTTRLPEHAAYSISMRYNDRASIIDGRKKNILTFFWGLCAFGLDFELCWCVFFCFYTIIAVHLIYNLYMMLYVIVSVGWLVASLVCFLLSWLDFPKELQEAEAKRQARYGMGGLDVTKKQHFVQWFPFGKWTS